MLTLLSLRIMDNVWKQVGLDYGIIPYQCLSTGPMVGLIEVVDPAETLADVQWRAGVRSAMNVRKDTLYDWVLEKTNSNDE